ncbi:ACP phosphodiesterase [Vibrio sp. 10N.261.51.F12]|uniref:acyl carrier protein phosphodiesterase n=1 Tax=Vibrio sp. 10N.261.51.F12 TaxID=3229679 RepID=UPI00354D3B53
MNFLAHLHIAHHCESNMLGNLLGDFVKGDPDKQFSPAIAKGIRLHRSVDSYTDTHEMVKHCKSLFSVDNRRFAPIAMDMFWDHCLAKSWDSHHAMTLASFVNFAQIEVNTACEVDSVLLPERFIRMSDYMWRERWLESYRDFDNVCYALERMSQRSLRMGPLAECGTDLARNYSVFSDCFDELYPNVLDFSLQTHTNLMVD